jgi:hypothetical protein
LICSALQQREWMLAIISMLPRVFGKTRSSSNLPKRGRELGKLSAAK